VLDRDGAMKLLKKNNLKIYFASWRLRQTNGQAHKKELLCNFRFTLFLPALLCIIFLGFPQLFCLYRFFLVGQSAFGSGL